jgi:hypothetical protein
MQYNKLILGILFPTQMETQLNKSIVWSTALNLEAIKPNKSQANSI